MVPFAAKSMSEEKHTVKNGASPGLQGRVRTLTLLEERWLSCVGHMAAAGKQEAERHPYGNYYGELSQAGLPFVLHEFFSYSHNTRHHEADM